MAWRDTPARKYADIKEQRAYSIGYVDGYYNYGRSEGAEAKAWPNAYSAGFNEGTSDRSS